MYITQGITKILIKSHCKSVGFSHPLLKHFLKGTNTEFGKKRFLSICTKQPQSLLESSTVHLGEYYRLTATEHLKPGVWGCDIFILFTFSVTHFSNEGKVREVHIAGMPLLSDSCKSQIVSIQSRLHTSRRFQWVKTERSSIKFHFSNIRHFCTGLCHVKHIEGDMNSIKTQFEINLSWQTPQFKGRLSCKGVKCLPA